MDTFSFHYFFPKLQFLGHLSNAKLLNFKFVWLTKNIKNPPDTIIKGLNFK